MTKVRCPKISTSLHRLFYNSWTGAENQERMKKIIAEIEEGKWYVSMECLFAGFDYALIGEEGSAKSSC